MALVSLALFATLLVGLPLLAAATGDRAVAMLEAFYSAGSLVFGGGHVVLPLLAERIVDPGWLDADRFLAGYGAAQAVPGPLMTFAGYLGAAMPEPPNGIAGGLLALGAIFLPSFLLVFGVLPFWSQLRRARGASRALAGVNAAVVGLLGAALYDPIATTAIRSPIDAAVALGAFLLLVAVRTPVWLVVVAGALAGHGLAALGVR
jgi:chromate transporter